MGEVGGAAPTRGVAVLAAALLVVPLSGCGLMPDRTTAGTTTKPSLAPLAAAESVAVGKRQVSARCAGTESDPSVLLLSGYDTELATAWDGVQPQLARFAHVCAYDRLGVGGSDAAPRRQTFADMADELDVVIDALELERPVVLVAHSLGGMVAATWSEAHREDLAGLVLV